MLFRSNSGDVDVDIDICRGDTSEQFFGGKNHRNTSFSSKNNHCSTVEDVIHIRDDQFVRTSSMDDSHSRYGNSDNNHIIGFSDSNTDQNMHNPITRHPRYSEKYISGHRNRNRDRAVARHMGSQIEKCTTKHVRERTNVRKLEYIRKGGYKQRLTDVDTDMDMDMDSISSDDSDILLMAAPIFSTDGWYQLPSVTEIEHLFLNAISKMKEIGIRGSEKEKEDDFKNSDARDQQNFAFIDEFQFDETQLVESHSHPWSRPKHIVESANSNNKKIINEIISYLFQQIIQLFAGFFYHLIFFLYHVNQIFCKKLQDSILQLNEKIQTRMKRSQIK